MRQNLNIISSILKMEDYRVGRYRTSDTKSAQIISVLSGVAWILLVWILRLDNTDGVGWAILSIPILVYFVNFINSPRANESFSSLQPNSDNIAFATVTILVLINWAKPTGETKTQLYKIILSAFILIMLSLINVISGETNTRQFLQGKSALQTAGIVLLAYALYSYYNIKELKSSKNRNSPIGIFF